MCKGHVHAELMAQYAQDALETDRPWERWQSRSKASERPGLAWRTLYGHPKWQDSRDYRRKPTQVRVAGEVFDDVIFSRDNAPKEVFVVRPIIQDVTVMLKGAPTTGYWASGMIHTTYEGALRHLEALKPKVL